MEIRDKDDKKGIIDLPTKLILTSEGASVFSKNPKVNVRLMKNKDGFTRDGIESSSYNATSVQKLIMNSYLEEIYLTEPELLSKRKQIIDTNNLVIFGILYKKLSPALAKMLFNSKVFVDFNRKNPKTKITDINHIDKVKAEGLKTQKKDLFESLEIEISSEAINKIIKNPGIEEEDKLIRIKSLPKFLNYIDPRIWYLYFIIYQTPLKDEVIDSFSDMIALYLDRTQIATHVSYLLMEIIQNAEKSHFEKILMQTKKIKTNKEADAYLVDLSRREAVVQACKVQKQFIDLSWDMNTEKTSIGLSYKISVTVTNHSIMGEKEKANLEKKMKAGTSSIPIAAYYEDAGDPEKLGAGLGLLYISYIEEICKKSSIKFNCILFPDPNKEKTTVRIDISF